MNGIALLMGLLFLSFVGSLLLGGRDNVSKGLPSGIAFVGLGFVVGPHALGLVERSMIADFEPIVQVALGWLAFIVGLDFGRVYGRRLRARPMALGVSCTLFTGALVAFAVHHALQIAPVPGISGDDAIVFAGGAGAVGAETTRYAAQWVSQRWNAKGALTDVLVETAAADDFAPLVAAGAIFAFVPVDGLTVALPATGWFTLSLAFGALLGTVTALLLRAAEGYELWGALVGTLLLGVGTAWKLGLSTIFVAFVMGVALAAASPNRRVLRRLVGPTERAALLPMLLLAGAAIDLRPLLESRALVSIAALVLLVRIAGKLLSGLVFRAIVPAVRPAGSAFGITLLSSGHVSITVAFVLALRFPGPVGDTLLVCAAVSAVMGELVSTLAIKRLLAERGELPPPSSASPSRGEPKSGPELDSEGAEA